MKFMNSSAITGIALILAGCVAYQPSIPQGYAGPVATIRDSVKTYGDSKADLFFVESVGDAKVESSLNRTQELNRGRGMTMTALTIKHDVAAGAVHLGVRGRTVYAAPILELTGAVYEIKGTVDFDAEAGKTYLLRGEFSDERSAIWVEDQSSGLIMGKKIEIDGSAKLSLLKK